MAQHFQSVDDVKRHFGALKTRFSGSAKKGGGGIGR